MNFLRTSNNSFFCGCQSRISFQMPVIPPNTSNIHHYNRSFTNFWAARYQISHLWPKQRSKFAKSAFTGNTHCRGKLFQLRGAVCFFWQKTTFAAGGSARCLPGSFTAGGSISSFLCESSTFLALQAVSQAAVGLSLT